MSPSNLDSELNNLWEEKQEVENAKEDPEDNFIPARLAEKSPDDEVLIRVTL